MSCHHEHTHGHGHNEDDHLAPPDSNPAQSLWQHIDHDHVITLNEAQEDAGAKILRKYSERLSTEPILESDVDEELLLIIPFNGEVQLHSIHLRSPADDRAPQKVRLLKNRTDLDFETVNDLPAVQTLEHPRGIGIGSAQNDGIAEYSVHRAKFSGLTSLAIHIQSNWGEETSALSYIGLSGSWKKLSKAPVVAMYEAAANPSDHKVKNEGLNEVLE